MKSSDLTVTICIVVIFMFLYFFNIFVVGYKKIKDNWPIYRCNPLVMPFAQVFGFDAGENFAYCIQNMQSAYMGYLTMPLNYNLNVMGSTGDSLTGNLMGVRGMFDQIRNFVQSTIQSVFNIFINMMVEMQRLFLNLKDVFAKLVGIMSVSMYTVDASIKTMESAWAGPPGELVRMLCFHPDTLLQLQNGAFVSMHNVPLNATLKSGSVVLAKMEISNINTTTGEQVESIYRLKNGENRESVLVSGSHLVFSKEEDRFIPVSAMHAEVSSTPCPTLTCLITSDHIIPIGEWIFHDWEDNNGSAAKTLGKERTAI